VLLLSIGGSTFIGFLDFKPSQGPAAAYGGHVDGKSSDGTMGLQDDDIDVHIQNEQPSPSAVGPRKGAMSGGKRQGQDSHIAGRGGWLADEDERLKQVPWGMGIRPPLGDVAMRPPHNTPCGLGCRLRAFAE